jgi:Fe-S-cluster containining protein
MVVEIKEQVTDDYIRWAEYHPCVKIIDIQGKHFLQLNIPCSQLKDGKCAIHTSKPGLCQAYDCALPAYSAFKFLIE